ncbi:MAG: TlpA family protein disulfide reductase [Thermoplasmatota archaeon]
MKRSFLIATIVIIAALSLIPFSASAEKVPPFSVTDSDGSVHTSDDYRGKVLVIQIMFTGCPVCNRNMPDIVRAYHTSKQAYYEDLEFLSVSVDSGDTNDMMDEFMGEYEADWPIAKETSFIEKFDAVEVPKIVIVNPLGDITFEHKGLISYEELVSEIENAFVYVRSGRSSFWDIPFPFPVSLLVIPVTAWIVNRRRMKLRSF